MLPSSSSTVSLSYIMQHPIYLHTGGWPVLWRNWILPLFYGQPVRMFPAENMVLFSGCRKSLLLDGGREGKFVCVCVKLWKEDEVEVMGSWQQCHLWARLRTNNSTQSPADAIVIDRFEAAKLNIFSKNRNLMTNLSTIFFLNKYYTSFGSR